MFLTHFCRAFSSHDVSNSKRGVGSGSEDGAAAAWDIVEVQDIGFGIRNLSSVFNFENNEMNRRTAEDFHISHQTCRVNIKTAQTVRN